MGVAGSVIFPFYEESFYFQGYAWAHELATRLEARFYTFTTLPSESVTHTGLVYQSLLAAQGYFLHHYHHDSNRYTRIQKETTIVRGAMKEQLPVFLKANPQSILVIDAAFREQIREHLNAIVKDSHSAVLLPEPVTEPGESIAIFFFDQLQRSEFYKIPKTFFDGLGQDRSMFNYLRNFFQKSDSNKRGSG